MGRVTAKYCLAINAGRGKFDERMNSTQLNCYMNPIITEKQSQKMHRTLVEIAEALHDKEESKHLRLSICERAWLLGIDKLLKEFGETTISHRS